MQQTATIKSGFSCGYRDDLHLNRECKRRFGMPPMRDVQRRREAASIASRSCNLAR